MKIDYMDVRQWLFRNAYVTLKHWRCPEIGDVTVRDVRLTLWHVLRNTHAKCQRRRRMPKAGK